MAFAQTATGQVDVGPRFAENRSLQTIFSDVALGGPYGSLSKSDIRIGDIGNHPSMQSTAAQTAGWFDVPEGSIKIHRGYFQVGDRAIVWTLPDGSSVILAEDEFKGEIGFWGGWFGPGIDGIVTPTNCRVRATNNTSPGLLAYGLLSPNIIREVVKREQTALDKQRASDNANGIGSLFKSGADAVKSGSTAVIVVALLVGAIYFSRGA